ncbi:MAG: sugar ABC transporter substrate-binding protein [Hungatella sp.]|nr:sugar ABC transporter substrate-binding protein [Hungatella sp.]
MKKTVCSILMTAMVLGLTACSQSGGGQQTTAAKQETEAPKGETAAGQNSGQESSGQEVSGGDRALKIGFTANNLENDTVVEALALLQQACDEKGWTLSTISYDSDISKLVDTLENFIVADVDVMIFQSANGEAVADVVKRAKDEGIVVVSYDDASHIGDYYLTQSDEEIGKAIGEMAAAYCKKNFGGNAAAVAVGLPSNEILKVREESFIKAYEAGCEGKVAHSMDGSTFSGDMAAAADQIVQAYPEAKIILCIADAWNVPMSAGFQAAGYTTEDIALFGCDCIPEVRNAWMNGEEIMIKGSCWTALPESLLEAFNRATQTALTGVYTDGEIHQEVTGVTAENVKEMFQ